MPLALALAAMATRFELLLDEGESLRAAGESALEAIAEAERRLSRFRRDSLVARLLGAADSNSEGAPRGVVLTRDELALFELCRRGCARSDGAFDPAFEPAGGAQPFSRWRIDRRTRRVVAPQRARRLDFGGVGKGYALDGAVRVLREAGVTRALLHGGTSSVAALGAPAGSAAWRVSLRDLATVALRDASLSVSAPRDGHVVDPRDGVPVERVQLAAVVARHGAVAEIASTALLVQVERLLRKDEAVTRERLASTRHAAGISAALVAWTDAAMRLQIATFGPRSDLFALAPSPTLPSTEACR